MSAKSLSASLAQFIHKVAVEFDLAQVTSVLEMAGSANRLWQFTTTQGAFVVKELPYDAKEQYLTLCNAATFEATLLGQRLISGPLPVPNQRGAYVSMLTGSRGQECPVRLHRWFVGAPPCLEDLTILVQAGRTLRTIQMAGALWSVRPAGSLRTWTTDPTALLEHCLALGYFDDASGLSLRSAIADALELVRAGEALAGDWIYTHRDHKPENCLVQDSILAVLDWDECHYCHPRLEAVESALRWSGSEEPQSEKFRAFLHGYNQAGVVLERLHEQDFAKWIADLLSWFCFQAQRSLGTWPEVTEHERATAILLAGDALTTLQTSVAAIPRWTRLL